MTKIGAGCFMRSPYDITLIQNRIGDMPLSHKDVTAILERAIFALRVITTPARSVGYELLRKLSRNRRTGPTFQFRAKHQGTDKIVNVRWVAPPATQELAQLDSLWSVASTSPDAKENNAASIAFAAARRFETDLKCSSVATSFGQFAALTHTFPDQEVVGLLMAEATWLPGEWLGFCVIRRTYRSNMFLDFLSTNPRAGNGARIGLVGTGILFVVSEIMTATGAQKLHIEGTPHSGKFYAELFGVTPANLLALPARRVRFALRNSEI
jgi:hypothetical protein